MIALFRQLRDATGQNPMIVFSLTLLVGLLVLAVLGPVMVPYHPLSGNLSDALQPPSPAHWFGTDQLGRDVLSRVIVAIWPDLGVAVAAVIMALVVGGGLGSLTGFYGGWSDWMVARVIDTIAAFPPFIFAMGLVAALGNKGLHVICAMAIIHLPGIVRESQSAMRRLRASGFVIPARFYGCRDTKLLFREWWPHIWPLMMMEGASCIEWTMLYVAGLSFIGLGANPLMPSWGLMMAEGARAMAVGGWWLALFPGLALMLVVLGWHGLGRWATRFNRAEDIIELFLNSINSGAIAPHRYQSTHPQNPLCDCGTVGPGC